MTWPLHGSLPPKGDLAGSLTPEQAFATVDRMLEETKDGPFHLAQSAIADMVVSAIEYNAATLNHYALHAYAVMPNHVHLLVTPRVDLATLTKSLKGITAKRANAMLGRTGTAFWQVESYEHPVRGQREFERIKTHIEHNPVRAWLVREPRQYRWSSACERGAAIVAAAGAT